MRTYFIDCSSGIGSGFFAEALERCVPRVVLVGFGGIDDRSERLLLPDADEERD